MRSLARAACTLASLFVAGPGFSQGWTSRFVRYDTERATVLFEPGGLHPQEMQDFVALVDRGIADIESLVGGGLPPEARCAGPIRYVVSSRVGMSRAFRRTVLLPLDRVHSRSAPYLHETVHLLVPSRHDGLWLTEGFACYVESWVSENLGGYDAHVFTRAGDRGIHRAAQRHLESEAGRAVLPYVGREGVPPALDADRGRVARPYYVLSHSLTKFLVDAVGLETTVRLFEAADLPAALARATGRGPEEWREAWLEALGAAHLTSMRPGETLDRLPSRPGWGHPRIASLSPSAAEFGERGFSGVLSPPAAQGRIGGRRGPRTPSGETRGPAGRGRS